MLADGARVVVVFARHAVACRRERYLNIQISNRIARAVKVKIFLRVYYRVAVELSQKVIENKITRTVRALVSHCLPCRRRQHDSTTAFTCLPALAKNIQLAQAAMMQALESPANSVILELQLGNDDTFPNSRSTPRNFVKTRYWCSQADASFGYAARYSCSYLQIYSYDLAVLYKLTIMQ